MAATAFSHFNLKNINLGARIGKGTVPVYKATMAGKPMAVKKMDCGRKNEIPLEVEVSSILPPHPNVLPLLGVAHSNDGFSIYICMELADKSLYHYLHEEKKKPSLQQSTKWATEIANGMDHIHDCGLAHRDLKSANVLLFEDVDVTKVCDFGSARVLERTATMTGMTGTYRWMAPEFNDEADTRVNRLCDVFSYAMVLYEIFAQKIPFSDIDEDIDAATSIREGKRPSIPPEVPLYIKALMHSCWRHNPYCRPNFERILLVLATSPTSEAEAEYILDEWSPLHKAAQSGGANAVQQFLGGDIDINSQTVDGKTALHLASQYGHINVVQVLVGAGVHINLQDKNGLSPLYMASDKGHTEVVDILLKSGADPMLTTKVPCYACLEMAAENGHTRTVERLLKGVAIVNYQNKFGQTALYCASRNGHIEVVQLLLQWHADASICDVNGDSALYHASERGLVSVVQALVGAHVNTNQKNKSGDTALLVASLRGYAEIVRLLLQEGANVSLCNKDGISPLYSASQEGHTEIVDMLLKKGADPNLATKEKSHAFPLAVAAQVGHTQIVERLLKEKVNINKQNGFGSTALSLASQYGHVEIVRILLHHHADVNIRDKEGDTAVDKAKNVGQTNIVALFQQYGKTQL